MSSTGGRISLAVGGLAACAVLSGCGEKAEPTEPGAGGQRAGAPALEEIASFDEPIHLAQPPAEADTLYVVERAGTIRAVSADGEVASRPFVDVSKDVLTEGEAGLFSLAFAPDYERSGRLYIAYASKRNSLVVEELTADPNAGTVDAGSRRTVLEIDHPNVIHWGGLLSFDPGGDLYLGTGDGGPPYPIPDTAQDPDSPLGKLLRIDPRGADAEVVALGLRNPWRYSFDRETGDLWIGDVGDFTQEEIDFTRRDEIEGTNYGWPDREGTAQTTSDVKAPGSAPPFLTYERSGKPDDPVCAVTGGHVVRDGDLPSLEGLYLYADFCEGRIMSVEPGARGEPKPEWIGLEAARLVSFAEDADGDIYVVSLEGPVYRLSAG